MDVKAGVTQGSILGPLIFCIYINDIENVSKSLNLLCIQMIRQFTLTWKIPRYCCGRKCIKLTE